MLPESSQMKNLAGVLIRAPIRVFWRPVGHPCSRRYVLIASSLPLRVLAGGGGGRSPVDDIFSVFYGLLWSLTGRLANIPFTIYRWCWNYLWHHACIIQASSREFSEDFQFCFVEFGPRIFLLQNLGPGPWTSDLRNLFFVIFTALKTFLFFRILKTNQHSELTPYWNRMWRSRSIWLAE